MFRHKVLIFTINDMNNNFSERRSHLANKVLEDSAIIIAAASVKSRISDTDYAYRQDSNFYYYLAMKSLNL